MSTTEYTVKDLKTLGKTIIVVGKPTGTRVVINLLVNNDPLNMGLCFSPRFDQTKIVLNSRVNGKWQTEQQARKGDFLWSQNDDAEYKLEVGTNEISCYWNGLKLEGCTFAHRVDASTYKGLEIRGLEVTKVDFEDNEASSAPVETQMDIKGIVALGKTFKVIANPVSVRSIFNFKANDDDNNIAFHFNPRFDQKVIVRNNRVNGAWQNEERSMVVPFSWQLNQEYEYNIYVTASYFSCVWDGVEVCRFNHRSPVEQDVGLAIKGMCIKSIRSI